MAVRVMCKIWKLRKFCASPRERTNRNDPKLFVSGVDGLCTGAGKSFMAVDAIRHRGRIVDIGIAKESRRGSLLALVGSVGEIPDSLFPAGGDWKPSSVVT
jgi:hypothetical protein